MSSATQNRKRRAVVSQHNREIPKGTLVSLLREAGFTREELIEFLEGDNYWVVSRVWERHYQNCGGLRPKHLFTGTDETE